MGIKAMSLQKVSIALGLIALTSCGPSPEALASADIAQCRQYGFQPGTNEFAKCRLDLDIARKNRGAIGAASRQPRSPRYDDYLPTLR